MLKKKQDLKHEDLYSPGCDTVDWVKLIVNWVEKSNAPDQVVAAKTIQDKVIMKLILPYPGQ